LVPVFDSSYEATPARAAQPAPTGSRRYSAARPSRNQIVLVLVLDCPVSDYEDDDEDEDEDEDEKFARPATIRTDTDRQGCLRYNRRGAD